MPRKPLIDHKEKDSLVPAVSLEEDRLKSYLDQARAEAQRIVKGAEQAAAERTRRALEELPALMERLRAERLEGSRQRAQSLRAELSAETEKSLKKAEGNCGEAASLVVSAVWPGDAE